MATEDTGTTADRWQMKQRGLGARLLSGHSPSHSLPAVPRAPASSEIGDGEAAPLSNKNAYLFSLAFSKHELGQGQGQAKTHSSLCKEQEKILLQTGTWTASSSFPVPLLTGAFHWRFGVTLGEEICKCFGNANFN